MCAIQGDIMENSKMRVLFICVYNSFRSQVAEAFLNHKYGDKFIAESAGYKTKEINPIAIEVMKEKGYDIANNSINRVFDYYNEGRSYQYVVTVCNRESEGDCPICPGNVIRLHWDGLDNPEEFIGTNEEKLEKARNLCNDIEKRVDEFVKII
ncbi:MAG: low molecular weight phosphatase family protein [Herbinix sp.]|jgi:arsenate reductase|nr:low molecular weight phosphatase family protein [Herbinix sp.]